MTQLVRTLYMLTDLKNTFNKFETLFHCLNDRSLN